MSKVNCEDIVVIDQIHKQFPAVGKSIIQNELRKERGDLTAAMKSIRNISEAITDADRVLGEEEKEYAYQSDESMDSEDSKDSDDEQNSDELAPIGNDKLIENDEDYFSPDEKEAEEIDEICNAKVDNYVEEGKTPSGFVDEQSEEFYRYITDDLITQFPGVPKECVKECVSYFYPNMGKIEHVLSEFQKHWVEYNRDYEGYKKHKKDRKQKHHRKEEIDIQIDPELAQETEQLEAQIREGKGLLEKQQLKELKHQLKGLKKKQRQQRKELKRQQKAERKAIKAEAKQLKRIERAKAKEERKAHKAVKEESKECERKARGEKDYEDDKFFKEIREEPTIIKQYLKEARKDLRKAEKKGTAEEVEFYTQKVAEYEKSLEEETDKVIDLTYQRYNKPNQTDTRLDLHGLKKNEALRLLERILSMKIQQITEKYGEKDHREPFEFNIVTGRGNHSRRAVLKPAVKDYLLANNIAYVEFSNGAGYTAKL